MARFVIGSVDSFPAGVQRRVVVNHRPLAIFNVEGRFFALKDACPHQGAALSDGVVRRALSADRPGAYRFAQEHCFVRCPRHGWEYSLESGESGSDVDRDRVRAFHAMVQSGEQLAAGPYVAETIKVSIEDEYVVVEM